MGKTALIAEPGSQQIVATREFGAPRDLVFRAFTDPELIARWLGPRQYTTIVERQENRHGGTWRFIHRGADGGEHSFRGVIHGTPTSDCIVRTFEYEGVPGHVSLETLALEDRGDKTFMRMNAVYQSVQDRDGMIQSGMESGYNESMERLDELLASLVPVG